MCVLFFVCMCLRERERERERERKHVFVHHCVVYYAVHLSVLVEFDLLTHLVISFKLLTATATLSG